MRINGCSNMPYSYTQTSRGITTRENISGKYTDSDSYHVEKGKAELPKDSVQTSEENKTLEPDKVKNTSSLPDHLFEYIQKQAVEDAKKGDYKSEEYKAHIQGYMRKNISPNRAKLISMYNPMVMNAKYTGKGPSYFSVPGFAGFTARFSVGRVFGAYMSIWNGSGEQVLSYSPPPNTGWHEHQTRAESNYLDKENAVYAAAFDEARKQMKAEAAGASTGSSFSIQA